MSELRKAVQRERGEDCDVRRGRHPFHPLVENGEVVVFEAGNQTEYTAPIATSLADLLRRAADCVDPSLRNQPGSTAMDAARSIEKINSKLFTRINTVCNHVARYKAESEDTDLTQALERVGSEYFTWDPSAGRGGQGDWRKFLELVSAAVPNKRGRAQAVGSARRLLDLAATHKWIARSPRHSPGYEIIPASWAGTFSAWRGAIAGTLSRPRSGLFSLLQALHDLDLAPDTATQRDWASVIAYLEARFTETGWSPSRRTRVRSTYRALRKVGVLKGPDWNGNRPDSVPTYTLLPNSFVKAVAERYGREGNRDGVREALAGQASPWAGGEAFESGLLAGPYGLRQWLLYHTALPLELSELNLPARGLFPRECIRRVSGKAGKGWSKGMIRHELAVLLYYAGWLKTERRADWTRDDLRILFDRENLDAFHSAVLSGAACSKNRYARTIDTLSQMASPYLEAVALRMGDESLADQLAQVSARMSSPNGVDGEPSLRMQLRAELDTDGIRIARRKARAIEEAWTKSRTLADTAFQQLERAGEHLICCLEDTSGPLADQIEAIRRGELQPSRRWAREVRDALYWHDQLNVPLRVRSSHLMDLGDRLHTEDFTHIRLSLPGWKTKSSGANDDFNPNYATPTSAAYPRDLYRLYVMPGGAREILCTDGSARLHDLDAFYVPARRGGTVRNKRLGATGFRGIVSRVVRRAERAIGVAEEELRNAGVLGTHFFRHAFGTSMVMAGHLQVAALYLHHKDTKMLLAIYSAADASRFDAGELHRQSRLAADA